jgi:hypothetical protein
MDHTSAYRMAVIACTTRDGTIWKDFHLHVNDRINPAILLGRIFSMSYCVWFSCRVYSHVCRVYFLRCVLCTSSSSSEMLPSSVRMVSSASALVADAVTGAVGWSWDSSPPPGGNDDDDDDNGDNGDDDDDEHVTHK